MSEASLARRQERRKVGLIVYKTEEEVHSALIEAVVFIVLLTSATILAMNSQQIYWFFAHNLLRRIFVDSFESREVLFALEEITTVEGWWLYLENHLMPIFDAILKYPTHIDANISDPIGLHSLPRLLSVNILMHQPRLRQIRVKPKKCKKNRFLEKYFTTCYESYDPSDQERSEYYKGSKFHELTRSSMRGVSAVIEQYEEGGYVKFLSPENADDELDELREEEWIDRGTRLVVLSFPIYNVNMGLLENIKIMVEVLPTGSVVCAYYSDILPLHSIWSTANPGIFVTACIFYLIVAYNTGNEIYEMIKFGFKEYIKVIWNYFDWGVILSAFTALAMSITYPIYINLFFDDIRTNKVTASIDAACFHHTFYVGALALCTFQLWIRIFRFISFNQTMLHFNLALRRCAPEIFGFALILLISFMAFALVGLLSFGIKHSDFTTFSHAFIFMFRIMLHDFDYEYFDQVDPIWGPIYFMCYILIVVFILVNMFLAIISQTYIDVKQYSEENRSVIKNVFSHFIEKIKHMFDNAEKKVLSMSKSRISPLDSESIGAQKKIQFAKDLSDADSGKIDTPPKRMSENEALKEFFGVQASKSTISTASSYKTIDYDSDELPDENRRLTTNDFLIGLNDRLDILETAYKKLNADIDIFMANLKP